MALSTKINRMIAPIVYSVASLMNKIIVKKENNILIYCANDVLNDNSEALARYLVSRDYVKKYKVIIGGASNLNDFDADFLEKVQFVSRKKSIFYYLKSKYVFYSFGSLPITPAKKQCVVNLFHGIPLKSFARMANKHNRKEFFFTHVLAASEIFRKVMAESFGCPQENVVICGEAKADRLHEEKKESEKKLVVWVPTFRQSKYLGYDDSAVTDLLPMFSEEEWDELESALKDVNIELVVKLHPMQNVNEFALKEYKYLKIYSDKAFRKDYGNLYALLAQSDALIADYSSVGLEYLVLNRPIGYVITDMDEYTDKRGFSFDNPFEFMPGEKITTKEALVSFLKDVREGIDLYYSERTKVREKVHHYKDGCNTQRLLDMVGIAL